MAPGRFSGRGRAGGRSNQAYRANKGKPNGGAKTQLKDSELKYCHGSAIQSSDFERTTEDIYNYIRKNVTHGKHIIDAMKSDDVECKFTKPVPVLDTSELSVVPKLASDEANLRDVQVAEQVNKSVMRRYEVKLAEHSKAESMYETNLVKVYGYIWERCSKNMQEELKGMSIYEDEIVDNPVKLMIEVRKLCCAQSTKKRHILIIASETIKTFHGIKQDSNESVNAYAQRFRSQRDVFKAFMSTKSQEQVLIIPSILNTYMGHNDSTTPIKIAPNVKAEDAAAEELRQRKELEDLRQEKAIEMFENYCAMMFIQGLDNARYTGFKNELANQYGLGNDQYPKTLKEAVETTLARKVDEKKPSSNTKDKSIDVFKEINMALLQKKEQLDKDKCYVCGKKGHYSNKCPIKSKTPQQEWWVNKGKETWSGMTSHGACQDQHQPRSSHHRTQGLHLDGQLLICGHILQ